MKNSILMAAVITLLGASPASADVIACLTKTVTRAELAELAKAAAVAEVAWGKLVGSTTAAKMVEEKLAYADWQVAERKFSLAQSRYVIGQSGGNGCLPY